MKHRSEILLLKHYHRRDASAHNAVIWRLSRFNPRNSAAHFEQCAAQPLYAKHGQGHAGPPAPVRSKVDPPIRAAFDADGRFANVSTLHYDWDQTYSATDYRNLMLSYSTTQIMSTADRSALLDEVETFIHAHFDGQITRPLVVTLTTATLA